MGQYHFLNRYDIDTGIFNLKIYFIFLFDIKSYTKYKKHSRLPNIL